MHDGWEMVKLGDLVRRRSDFTLVDPDHEYLIAGVQRSGWGLKRNAPARGDSMKFQKLMELEPGNLVYRTITAFEAPSTVVPDLSDPLFVTPQAFPVYRIDQTLLDPRFMALHTTSAKFHKEMAVRCVGTVLRRKTLSKSAFEEIPVPLPPLHEQRRIVDLIAAVDDGIDAAEKLSQGSFEVLDQLREQLIWSSRPRTALGNVVEISGRLVDPTAPEFSKLPHIGTERIVKNTGELVDVVSAEEDGVRSAKFLHAEGDVVYSKIRPNLRKVARPDWAGLCSADAYPLKPKGGGDFSFLRHLLLTEKFTQKAVEKSGRTKMPKINKTELFSIAVPDILPTEQVLIGRQLDSIEKARFAARAHADSLRDLRSNLLTVLLSNEHEIPETYDKFLKEEVAA